jgi:hypothetical protein
MQFYNKMKCIKKIVLKRIYRKASFCVILRYLIPNDSQKKTNLKATNLYVNTIGGIFFLRGGKYLKFVSKDRKQMFPTTPLFSCLT